MAIIQRREGVEKVGQVNGILTPMGHITRAEELAPDFTTSIMGNMGESCPSRMMRLETWLECVPGEEGDIRGPSAWIFAVIGDRKYQRISRLININGVCLEA